MATNTIIAWTDHTFNIAWGCTKVSDGCKHCYAETLSTRYGHSAWGPKGTRRTLSAHHWNDPHRWEREAAASGERRLVFSSSMCDNFEDHPVIIRELGRLWPIIRATPHLDWQLLTKRPERIAESLPDDWGAHGYPNVWLGTSVEDMRVARRVDHLRAVPAVVRFLSYEPALGPLDDLDLTGIDWVIYGGESGPGYRPHDLAWPRAMRAKCDAAGVAFFFKQSSAPRTEMGTELDGETVRAFPKARRVPQRPRPGYAGGVRLAYASAAR